MRLIDRYICREIISHAALGLAVFTFVLFIPQLVRLMELMVRHSADAPSVALLFACTLPGVLTFTLPMSVLVGVLIGLGRMSADSEVIALHALGINQRRLLLPVGALALGTALLTGAMTFWLVPASLRTFRALEERLRSSQASFEIQPRVFDERFPKLVLYVQDVEAAATRWRGIFLAETGAENGSRVTLAEEAIVIADREPGKIQLHLQSGSTHEYNLREPDRYSVTTFGQSDIPITAGEFARAGAVRLTPPERPLGQLITAAGPEWRELRVELHRRLAFPMASLAFALLAVPVGARPRRGGRAAGLILTLLLICGYYLLFITGAGMARQGLVSPGLGIWSANLIAALLGIFLLPRMEQVGAEGVFTRWSEAIAGWRHRLVLSREAANALALSREAANVHSAAAEIPTPSPDGPVRKTPASASPPAKGGAAHRSGDGWPLLMDLYILRRFFTFFFMMLAGFLILFHSFTFFELLNDIARNRIPFLVVFDYFRYLTPLLIYQLLPLAVLVAVIVTMSVLAKNNELVAFKANGVSLYRLAVPLLGAGLVLASAMLLLDDTYLPYTNKRQDALRNQIKGRPTQTFFQPRRQWIFGEGTRLYNYELFDPENRLFGGLNVFELDPETFQMRRRVYAARATWNDALKTWNLEDGWARDFEGSNIKQFVPFRQTQLSELTEPPAYFFREVRPYHQMNLRELGQYIGDLQQAGFDVARISVQWHKKLAYPLMAPIIVLLGIPFAAVFRARSTMGGVALSVAIGIGYWAVSALFEAMGSVGQLPPFLAAWSPDTIFAFLGIYFFLKMPT
ncbi:MAG: LPS export ABC transporter permease LptF [Acidobacteria bacterium]|nr:LPS export ABC transporter permease LptF [Acidobacteriota bacterium]